MLELVKAKDWRDFNYILKVNIGLSLEEAFSLLENEEIKHRIMETYTPIIVDYLYEFFHPTNLESNLKYINSFTTSKGYGAIDPSDFKKTLSKVVDTIMKEHLKIDMNSLFYLDRLENNIKTMLRLGHDEDLNLANIDKVELMNKIGEIQKEELLDPIGEAYRLYKKASEHPECLKVLLCFINHPNNVATNIEFKGTMTRFFR